MPRVSAFGSRSISVHLARGLIGIASVGAAVRLSDWSIWSTLALLAVAVWMLRGCPVCWLVGLAETVASRIHEEEG